MDISFITPSINSFGPLPGGDGNGWYTGDLNSGHACGSVTPDPCDIGGFQLCCIGFQGSFGGQFVVAVVGTATQSLFTTIEFTDKNGDPESYDTSTAVFDTATYPGFSVWVWTPALVTYPFLGGPATYNITFTGGAPPDVQIPVTAGMTPADAAQALVDAGFVVGPNIFAYGDFPPGTVINTNPPGLTSAPSGSTVSLVISQGPAPVEVPDLFKLPVRAGADLLLATRLVPGSPRPVVTTAVRPGLIVDQFPLAGTIVPQGTTVNFSYSTFGLTFDASRTVISQYANSPTLMRLVENMNEYIDPRVNMQMFYDYVWNVDTAVGFGLDIWGKIVGVSRLLKIPANTKTFGFANADFPPDWAPFNQGSFYTGVNSGQAFILPDGVYRTLVLTKALANIVATTAASLNRLLRNLFPGRGVAYVVDNGGMSMTFVFEFDISAAEYAILTQSGALPHPAGVRFNVVVIPAGIFGFQEQGGTAEPFDSGVFYQPPT